MVIISEKAYLAFVGVQQLAPNKNNKKKGGKTGENCTPIPGGCFCVRFKTKIGLTSQFIRQYLMKLLVGLHRNHDKYRVRHSFPECQNIF